MDPFLDLLAGWYVILSQVKMYIYTYCVSVSSAIMLLFLPVSSYSPNRFNVTWSFNSSRDTTFPCCILVVWPCASKIGYVFKGCIVFQILRTKFKFELSSENIWSYTPLPKRPPMTFSPNFVGHNIIRKPHYLGSNKCLEG